MVNIQKKQKKTLKSIRIHQLIKFNLLESKNIVTVYIQSFDYDPITISSNRETYIHDIFQSF